MPGLWENPVDGVMLMNLLLSRKKMKSGIGGLAVSMGIIAGRSPSILRMYPYHNLRIHIVVVTDLAYVLFVSNMPLFTLKL